MAEESFAKRAAKQREIAILRSLLARFNEHGCFDTTLDHVTAEVGIGRGTLYRHYSSREELFEAALQAGIEALIARCQEIWKEHPEDFDAGFRTLIGELVSLNQRGDPLSPATLGRLRCSCEWLSPSHREDGNLEAAFTPMVRGWQAVGLFERTADPSWIAAVTVALVNSLAVTRHGGKKLLQQSAASAGPWTPAHEADIASRIVGVIRRAFAPAPQSSTAGMGL